MKAVVLFILLFCFLPGAEQSRSSFSHVVTTRKLPQKKNTITIGGIFPMSGSWAGGIGCFPAVLKALEDVNMNSSVLPHHYLVLHSNDSRCEPGLGINALFDLIREPPSKLMILGPGCSTVSAFVAEAAKMWNLVVLSYGSSSPALSNRKRFPTFFRTHPSATLENPARIRLIKEFNWTHISIIQQIEEVFTTTAENLEILARENNVSIITRQSFLTDPVDAVKNLKKHDARIIIGLFYENMARAVLCAAYKEKLTSSKHVWFLIGWYSNNWYKDELAVSVSNTTNCTIAEMRAAAEGHFTVEPVFLDRFGGTTISGITVRKFEDYIHKFASPTDPGYVEAPLAYDAVWAMALAINSAVGTLKSKGLRIEDFSYTNATIMEELKSSLETTRFQGLSSYVAFSSTGDRIAKILIEQLQNDSYVTIGYYDSQTDHLLTARRGGENASRYGLVDYRFYEKSSLPPKDRKLIQFEFLYISLVVIVAVWLMSFLHGCCCVAFFVTSDVLADHLPFRCSVPWLNAVILAGCITTNIGVCISGLANSSLTQGYGGTIFIHSGFFLLSLGFTLTVGGMFLKTLLLRRAVPRASSIAKDPVTGKMLVEKSESHSNLGIIWYEQLLAAVFIVFDLAFNIVWPIVDPVSMRVKELPSEERMSKEDDDIFIRPRLFVYDCFYLTVWLAVGLGEKCALLLTASFFSFDTRNLKHRQINDSKFINLSVYNIAVFALITVPLTLLIKDKPTASFSFTAGAALLCTWITLGLIAVPKIFALTRYAHEKSGGILRPRKSIASRKSSSKSTSDGASEKVDEDNGTGVSEDAKLKKLIEENEEIKNLISEKEKRLAELREQLLNRLQNELLRSDVKQADATENGDLVAINSRDDLSGVRPRTGTAPSTAELRLRTGASSNSNERQSLLPIGRSETRTNIELSESHF